MNANHNEAVDNLKKNQEEENDVKMKTTNINFSMKQHIWNSDFTIPDFSWRNQIKDRPNWEFKPSPIAEAEHKLKIKVN